MKSLRFYQVTGGILIVLYLIVQFNRPPKVNWSETLSSKDKIPFGTYILNEQLHDIFPGSKIVSYRQPAYSLIAEDSVKNATYIIICRSISFTKADYAQLTNYLKQGNDVLIASEDFGEALKKYLNIETEMYFKFGAAPIGINYINPNLNAKEYFIDKESGNVYFKKFDTVKAKVIGENSYHKANFIKFNIGKGSLYLVANPKLFTNYSLLKNDGAAYAATALSFLKPTSKIIIDEYYTQGDIGNRSPMRVFLSNTTLQWAYYIVIFTLIAFVLFEIKRRQRIIPVIEPLKNSTLDFVTVVGQVYYETRNNADIAQKKIRYFLNYLRDEHQVKTSKLDNEFVERLTEKMDIDRSFVNELVNYINYISVQHKVNDNELIELNKLIEQFYIKSR